VIGRVALALVGLAAAACGARGGLADDIGPGDADGDADADADADTDADADGDCDLEPQGTGCPCDPGAVEVCYSGPEGTAPLGECGAGIRVCRADRWGTCEGEVLPAPEQSNGLDDDCDGEVDEDDVEPACLGSNHECFAAEPGCRRWGGSPGLATTPEGSLTLDEATDESTWTGTLEFDCITGGFLLLVDAVTSDGSRIDMGFRSAFGASDLPAAEWIDLGTIPADEPSFPLDEYVDNPHAAEYRAVLRRGDRDAPILRRLDVCWICEFI